MEENTQALPGRWVVAVLLAGIALMQGPLPAQVSTTPAAPPTWPRTFAKDANSVLMYQPQVDGWKDYEKIRFRAAIAVTADGAPKPEYGVLAVQADTEVMHDERRVLMTNMDFAIRFPGMPPDKVAPLEAVVREFLPKTGFIDTSLDQVLACVQEPPKVPKANLNLDPPPIYYSETPAILVIYIGQPQFKPIKDTQLMLAANTNWAVLMDIKSGQYYLLNEQSWLTAPDALKGPWTPAQRLPDEFAKLPKDGNWEDIQKQIPGKQLKSAPRVITSTEPAELIETQGPAAYTPISGTRLMYVSNPLTPAFWDLADNNYYFLAAGRWFRAKDLSGPWSAASADLPVEFVKIPSDSPMGFVLASVPNTQEAQDAILLAAVPRKATIKISDAKVNVTYDGAPKFVAIPGTSMKYAANTTSQVIFADSKYYCCAQGVWFVSPAATGPWAVCTSVPSVIYTIPPSCPVYNCTYVYVYDSTPDTVVVGCTSGYSGEYVAATGALMFGAGMLIGAAIADNDNCYYPYYPAHYSYGCAGYYHYGYGGYYRTGAAHYGPYGGAGWTAGYNPATGTYYRGGGAYGPYGSVHGGQAYNPWTNTYAAHAGGSSGYQSWGSSYVQRGDDWAAAGHQSGVRGSAGWAETSSGNYAAGVHSNVTDSTLAKTSQGVYAGHDGNVYKNTGDGWQKYSGGGNWEDTSWNRSTAQQNAGDARSSAGSYRSDWSSNSSQWKSEWQDRSSSFSQRDVESSLNRDSWSRQRGSENTASSWQSRSGSWGGARGGGRRR